MHSIESIIEIALTLLTVLAVLRFLMIYFASPWRHPIGQWCYKLTEFAVNPLKKIFPKSPRFDYASLFWAYLLDIVLVTLNMIGFSQIHLTQFIYALPFVIFMAMIAVIKQAIYILMTSVFVYAVLSWMSPSNELMPLARSLTAPFLTPVRRILPPLGQLDLSPVVLMIIYQLTITILIGALEMLIEQLL
ncbi:MAG: YggT family protein [Ferrovum sp. 37-45-19]|jgi:YggT family protein|uniref:YggT family protein n=1 Tax=Ferrovum sp. JA12 TaxID=1356299 RepID=UPI000702ED42|nr:YggT family protein [Ferrovum sp. JA12]OYV80506.1 MAG: YggT family protein [Ferrovum sp. 21-44-67]OYV94821.1 MAG: YggT family protein [Ferrovum sp. 37-45-19]OZB34146.1 MAG: YggT family protein [Ferrovum sp. 34-44-207]HQT81052.1 YggT family protein [Ferrovaceae bacterium]KRH79223.1 YGGT family protein [Ferrovum sp. JA12]